MTISTQSEGNDAARVNHFDLTWRAMHGKLRQRARLLCKGDTYRADDLLSDTALKVQLYMLRSPERVKNLAGFLFLALNHAFLDNTRRRTREGRIIDRSPEWDDDVVVAIADHAPAADQQLALKQQLARMTVVLENLPLQQQTLFVLKFKEERPYPQIAAELGINETLARKRVELLRKELRKKLD